MIYGDIQVIGKELIAQLTELFKSFDVDNISAIKRVAKELLAADEHFSVDDMLQICREHKIELGVDEVKNLLNGLVDAGFLTVVKFAADDVVRYELIHQQEHHDHFVCIKCKKILEFSDEQLEQMQDSVTFKKGWKPLFHKLEVYGLCGECSKVAAQPISITFAKEDTIVELFALKGGWGSRKRLAELGFVEKEKIRILKNSDFGPIVLEVKGARIAIGRQEAQNILILEK